MEVDFSPEQIVELSRIASFHGTSASQLVKEAAMRAVEEDRRFLEAVNRGIAQANRGELIDHSEVVARFEGKFGI